jgi:hypothetical protein
MGKTISLFMWEVGSLLPKSDKEYSCYDMVYGKRFSFYNTNWGFARTLEEAKNYALCDIKNPLSYAVVSEQIFDEDIFENGVPTDNEIEELTTEGVDFSEDAVVWSVAISKGGKNVEDFIKVANDEDIF